MCIRDSHYDHARALGQIRALEVRVAHDAANLMNVFYQRQGLKLGDIKQGYLAARIADSELLAALSPVED